MKWQTNAVLVLLFSVALVAPAQSPALGQTPTTDTQVRGSWIDPATGLMWAGKDNGKDVSWRGAVKYCQKLKLASYSDWRLATLFELQPLYDQKALAPGLTSRHNDIQALWHVRGNLFLAGYPWANDQSRHSSGYHSYFDFNDGKSNDQPSGFLYSGSFMRALCVRGSGDPLGGQRQR